MLDLYPHLHTEIDLRDELARTLDGDNWEIGKKQPLIYRRMRRDTADQILPCACLNRDTGEGSRDQFCPYCHGEGFLWDEEWIYGIKILPRLGMRRRMDTVESAEVGMMFPQFTFLALPYDASPTLQDRIISPQTDTEGQPTNPIKIRNYYYVEKADCMLGEHGRIEYWRLMLRNRLPEQPLPWPIPSSSV
jgi:hypothetical protein